MCRNAGISMFSKVLLLPYPNSLAPGPTFWHRNLTPFKVSPKHSWLVRHVPVNSSGQLSGQMLCDICCFFNLFGWLALSLGTALPTSITASLWASLHSEAYRQVGTCMSWHDLAVSPQPLGDQGYPTPTEVWRGKMIGKWVDLGESPQGLLEVTRSSLET